MAYLDPEMNQLLNYFGMAAESLPEPPVSERQPSVDLYNIISQSNKYLSGLDPAVEVLAKKLIVECLKKGIQVELTSGYRTLTEQDKLYQQGRGANGDIVTGAKAGMSHHNWGLAFDVAPLNDEGEPHWPNDNSLWSNIGNIGKSLGLKWGGDFSNRKDYSHFEANTPLADLLTGKTRSIYSDLNLSRVQKNPVKQNVKQTVTVSKPSNGYKRMTQAGHELQQIAQHILKETRGEPIGTKVPFQLGGKEYMAVREIHNNGPNAREGLNVDHPGISLFEKV